MTPVGRGYDTLWNLATDGLPESTYFRNGYENCIFKFIVHTRQEMSEIKQKRKEVLLLTLTLKTTFISNSLDKTNEMLPENWSRLFLFEKKNQIQLKYS